jgi:hypothetical protein
LSGALPLLGRLDRAVRQSVASGEIGAAKSMRLHIGAPVAQLPDIEALLALGDVLFASTRHRIERLDGEKTQNVLCVWSEGQMATISLAPAMPPLIVLTVLGQRGALHFEDRGL